jgi:hypothetical protein
MGAAMKIEGQIDDRTIYVDTIGGRERRAITAGGPQAAERIFSIMRQQNGFAKSAPVPIEPAK